jgi:MYXO-CTERM domain-containing protein
MRSLFRVLTPGAFLAGVLAASAPAHAVTIVPLSLSPLSLPSHPGAVIPSGTFVQKTAVYDFTFSTKGHPYDVLMQMQASNLKTGQPGKLAFELFSGSPGTGTWIANSGGTPTAATLLDVLQPGSYYMQLSTVKAPKELLTGGVTLLSTVPEPASWAMALVGFGGLGAMMRRRRMAGAAAA